jgi:hypothetical protein
MRWISILLVLSLGLVGCSAEEAPEETADLPEVAFPAVAWTGDRLFVYAGERATSDEPFVNEAGLVDPERRGVELLPEPPVDGALEVTTALLVEDEVLLTGLHCAEPQPEVEECPPTDYTALAYSLADDEWRSVALPAQLRGAQGRHEALGATSDGRAVYRFRPSGGSAFFWTYAPDDDRWERIPPPTGRLDDACLAGDRLVALTVRFAGAGFSHPRLNVRVLQGGGGAWRATEPAEGVSVDELSVGCLDDAALVHDRRLEVRRLHPLGAGTSWVETTRPPPGGSSYRASFWTGHELVFLSLSPPDFPAGGPGLAYDPATDRWRALRGAPRADEPVAVAEGALVGLDGVYAL